MLPGFKGVFLIRIVSFLLFGLLLCHARTHIHTNALIHESSPYLQMHAHNPVDWYPYGDKAFAKARRENKLIFLSIGFSTCHWCHVMEKESFENPRIAALLNRDYVSIKVDKEEMPQIDTYYQHLFSKLQNRRNGWPLTILMTPEREVLFMGTYIPDVKRYGVEGLETLLPKYARLHSVNKVKERKIVQANLAKISQSSKADAVRDDANISARYVQKMWKRFDRIYKGFDRRPHFPMASNLMLLLEIYGLEGDKKAFKMADETLTAMALGGIYDQVEGGFFRYATDPDWVLPHYEKMLYTNAELLQVYIRAWFLTQNPLYKKVVFQTITHYHEKLEKNGLFFAATDADSMGEEGGYFTYRYADVYKALEKRGYPKEKIEDLLDYFDITDPGNFKDDKSNVQCNTGYDAPPKDAGKVLMVLREMRKVRRYPFRDRKIITSWNAMMVKTLLQASGLDTKYLKEGLESLQALLKRNMQEGKLWHYTIGNAKPTKKALLEDYAFLVDALIEAYEQSYEKAYLVKAEKLVKEAIAKFYDGKQWYINEGEPKVKTRYLDKYYTTPLARMFDDMLRLSALTYDLQLYSETKQMITHEKRSILEAFDKAPHALHLLLRLDYGDVVLKAPRADLLQKKREISAVKYPFLLTKVEKSPLWLLCDIQSCFYYDIDFDKVVREIEKRGDKAEKKRGP